MDSFSQFGNRIFALILLIAGLRVGEGGSLAAGSAILYHHHRSPGLLQTLSESDVRSGTGSL